MTVFDRCGGVFPYRPHYCLAIGMPHTDAARLEGRHFTGPLAELHRVIRESDGPAIYEETGE